MEKMKIVFMGTPDFAVPSLEAIHKEGYPIAAVVTAPDKPRGRGRKPGESPVKTFAKSHNLPLLQPEKLKSQEFIATLESLNADLFVVVAFRMLPEVVWSMPPKGTFNLHASLLPDYRGAAPINWAIINGEKETGLTTFFLKHEIDTGDIILQEKELISAEDDAGSLYQRLMFRGAELVLKTLRKIDSGDIELSRQDPNHPRKHAPKIFREDCQIDWNRSGKEIVNFIRGLSPYPGAWSKHEGKVYKFFKAELSREQLHSGTWSGKDDTLLIGTSDRAISILEMQPEGKRRMKTTEFLKGFRTA